MPDLRIITQGRLTPPGSPHTETVYRVSLDLSRLPELVAKAAKNKRRRTLIGPLVVEVVCERTTEGTHAR